MENGVSLIQQPSKYLQKIQQKTTIFNGLIFLILINLIFFNF